MGLRFEPYNPMLSYRVGGYVDLPAAAWPLPPEFPFTLRAGRSWNVSVKFCGPGSLEGVPPPTSPVQGIRSWVSTPRPRVSTDRKRLGAVVREGLAPSASPSGPAGRIAPVAAGPSYGPCIRGRPDMSTRSPGQLRWGSAELDRRDEAWVGAVDNASVVHGPVHGMRDECARDLLGHFSEPGVQVSSFVGVELPGS